jgi:hypothetical protein
MIDYNEEFKLILCTRNAQPLIPMHVSSLISEVIRCTVIKSILRWHLHRPSLLSQQYDSLDQLYHHTSWTSWTAACEDNQI